MKVEIHKEDVHFIKRNGEHLLVTTKPNGYAGTDSFIKDKDKLEEWFKIAERILELQIK